MMNETLYLNAKISMEFTECFIKNFKSTTVNINTRLKANVI